MTILYDEITHFQLLGYKLNIIYAIMHEFSKKCICVAQFICLSKQKFDKTAFICLHKEILCRLFIFDKCRNAVNGTEIYQHDRDDGEHIPERLRDPLVEKVKQRVVGRH